MLYTNTLSEISNNINTGIEYEIALFYKLLKKIPSEQTKVMATLNSRDDASKIIHIITQTDTTSIEKALMARGLTLEDVTFETQNDKVGPADIVMLVSNGMNQSKIGLSVKYANTCTLNVTGRNFITDFQISQLKNKLPAYTQNYIKEMTRKYGDVDNWFRKRKPSETTDAYIDLVRDAIIANWKYVENKTTLLSALFHIDSPIEFWVITYGNNGFTLKTKPQTIDMSRADDVTVAKYQKSYVAFYLDGNMVGHMQVKFNNGFIEKCKRNSPDVIHQGIRMAYGHPFSSWNFNVEK
jgi:hypothetical protein